MGKEKTLRGPCTSSESYFGNTTAQLLLQGPHSGVGARAPHFGRSAKDDSTSDAVEPPGPGASCGTASSSLESPDAWRDKFSEVRVRSNHQRRFSTGSPWEDGLRLRRLPVQSPMWSPGTPPGTDAAPLAPSAGRSNAENVLKRASPALASAKLRATPAARSELEEAILLSSTGPGGRTARGSTRQLPTWTSPGELHVKSLVPRHPDDRPHCPPGSIAPPSTPMTGVLLYVPARCGAGTAGQGSPGSSASVEAGRTGNVDVPAAARQDWLTRPQNVFDPAEVSAEGEEGGEWLSACSSFNSKQVRPVNLPHQHSWS